MFNVSFLVLTVVTIALMVMMSFQGVDAQINLLPDWNPGAARPVTQHRVTSPRGSSNCARYLDINIHGNPNCPLDQQFFDTQTCQFVCDVLLDSIPSRNGVTKTHTP